MGGCIGINRSRSSGINGSIENVSRPNSDPEILEDNVISLSCDEDTWLYKVDTSDAGQQKHVEPSPPTAGSTRKNHPLCHDTIRWKSDVPLTEGQLRSKRDEFWDTAPAFEGRKEIWDALRAAAVAAESLDFILAQAILDGANISVPNGFLTECYDELGTRYQVPVYCLSYPINIVKEDNGRESPIESTDPEESGQEIMLKLRLSSNCQDVKLPLYTSDTIGMAKKKLESQEGLEPSRQRWFFGGKLLGDKLHIEEAKISPGFVIQVIVNNESGLRVDS